MLFRSNPDNDNAYYEDPLQRIERRREKQKEIQQAIDQDVPMADAPTAQQKPREEKRSLRKSELQNYVSPKSVLDKVLNTPVTVAVGELLAVSKEVSHQVQEVIKLKLSKGPEAKPATQYVDTGKEIGRAHV